MKSNFLGRLRYLAIFMLMLTLSIDAAALDKTAKPSSVRLSGHVPTKAIVNAAFMENLDADVTVPITFVLPLRNQKALEELIQHIYDPTDQQHYGNYLTSEEFIEMFAPTQKDYDQVIAHAKKSGLNVISTHPNRTLLNVSGPTKSIETAFNLNLYLYQQASGRKFYAPNNDPEVPVAIASVISGIVGLDNSAVWRPYNHRKEVSTETSGATNPASYPSGPSGGFAPTDVKIAYNLTGVSANGSGQNIALFELSSYQTSDITAYATYFGLPSPQLHTILVDGGSAGGGGEDEVTLDIQLALALAPHSQIYVYEGPNSGQGVLDTYNRIATDNIAKQVSSSWGLGENYVSSQSLQAENAIFQQMASQGQSIYIAAGDNGAYADYPTETLVVGDPAAQPYVVGVGGTSLSVNSSTGAYASETVWNDGVGGGAGGGGVSSVWTIPSWQTNVSTTYSKTHRNVPDISLNSDQDRGYSIYLNGQWTIYGGTSCAAPLWAAFTALVNQQRLSASMSPLGFPNPQLYTIGVASQVPNYHDITVGNNYFYDAIVGYDNASGWGSFNGANLFASLTKSSTDIPMVSITSPANGSTVSGAVTITATATDSLGIARVDFYVDTTLIGSDTVAPYIAILHTKKLKLSNGTHKVKAIAYNTAGNSAQSTVTVNVENAQD